MQFIYLPIKILVGVKMCDNIINIGSEYFLQIGIGMAHFAYLKHLNTKTLKH